MMPDEAVIKILNEQINVYKMLVDLLQRACLPELNGLGVEALSKEKDTLITRLRLLEEKRMRLFMKHFNGDVSLQKLGELTGDDIFMEIRSKLLSLLQSIEELNQFDGLGHFLNYIKLETTVGFLGLSGRNRGAGADISR